MSLAVLQDLNDVVLDSGTLLDAVVATTAGIVSKPLVPRPQAYGIIFYCAAPVAGVFQVLTKQLNGSIGLRSTIIYSTPNTLIQAQVDFAPQCQVVFVPSTTSANRVYVEGYSYGHPERSL